MDDNNTITTNMDESFYWLYSAMVDLHNKVMQGNEKQLPADTDHEKIMNHIISMIEKIDKEEDSK